MKFPIPKTVPLITPNKFKCKSIVSPVIYGNTIGDKGMLAQPDKGTDEVSIEIEGEVLYFLSGASLKVGDVRPARCLITRNTDK